MRINVNLYPKDGYVFKDKDGSIHRSQKGWRDLHARVVTYRRVNKLPPGDPENEIHAQACASNPSYCSDGNPPPVTPSRASLKGAILKWLSEGRREHAKGNTRLTTPEVAADRAGVCANCPFNVALKEGCAPCRAFITEARREILPKRTIDGRLNACEKLQVDAATMVHLDVSAVDQADLPDHCWMKRRQ